MSLLEHNLRALFAHPIESCFKCAPAIMSSEEVKIATDGVLINKQRVC